MNGKRPHIIIILLIGPWLPACKQVYTPPALQTNPNILVIDGIINGNIATASIFHLSRTQKIGDSLGANSPELQARINILGSGGETYPLTEQGNGLYSTAPLSLNTAEKYQLRIITSNGYQYQSDTVSILNCPAIDSLSWIQQTNTGNVVVSINSHDPANNSHYYRFTWSETWQYSTELAGELALQGNLISYADSNTQTTTCWRSDSSTDILLANTSALSQDIVSQAYLATIPLGSQKISLRYSILASQYILTPAASQYWTILQSNTQNLGSLFDPEPSQLTTNYHCTSNPNEPVIGYLSASRTAQQRLFIGYRQVKDWDTVGAGCPIIEIPQNPTNFELYTYTDTTWWPYYFTSTDSIVLSHRTCLDCRLQGGANQKPSFW